MELMIIKDVMIGKKGQVILTGPLLLKEVSRRSEVERAFGSQVYIRDNAGKQMLAPVRGVSVSQAMSGDWQVSLAIDYPHQPSGIALDTSITDKP